MQLDTALVVEPPQVAVDPGDTFSVEVVIRDVTNLGGYQFTIAFDPGVVEVSGAEDGGFLGETGRSVLALGPDIDNEAGTVGFGAASVGEAAGPDGSGVLTRVTLRALKDGVSELDLVDSELQILDPTGGKIRVSAQDGWVQVGAGSTATPTPTATSLGPAPATPTETPTASATATPGQATTATPGQAPTETATPGETTTETATPSQAATETPDEAPTRTATPSSTAPGMTPEPTVPTATPTRAAETTPTSAPTAPATETGPAEDEEQKPTATRGASEAEDGDEPRRRLTIWLIVGAVLLAAVGIAVIAGGIYFFGADEEGETVSDDKGEAVD